MTNDNWLLRCCHHKDRACLDCCLAEVKSHTLSVRSESHHTKEHGSATKLKERLVLCPHQMPFPARGHADDKLPRNDLTADRALHWSSTLFFDSVHPQVRAWVEAKVKTRKRAIADSDSDSDGRGSSPARCLKNNIDETKDLLDFIVWRYCRVTIESWDKFNELVVRLASGYTRNYIGITRYVRRRARGSKKRRMNGHCNRFDLMYMLMYSAIGISGVEMSLIQMIQSDPSTAQGNENKDNGGTGFSVDRAGFLYLAVA